MPSYLHGDFISLELKKLRAQEAPGSTSELKRRMLNDRLMFAERGFLDAEGLRGREWFKHLVRIGVRSTMGCLFHLRALSNLVGLRMVDNYRFGYAVVLWDLKSDGFCQYDRESSDRRQH